MAHKRDDIKARIQQDTKERDLPRENANLELVGFRINPRDIRALRRHFSGQGLGLSAGIRMVLVQYMKSKGIR